MTNTPEELSAEWKALKTEMLACNRRELRALGKLVRDLLLEVHPTSPTLRGRCYTATGLLLNALISLHPPLNPRFQDGWILPPGQEKVPKQNNHGWIALTLDHEEYILDVTLTQFEPLLGRRIPPVLLLKRERAEQVFFYRDPEPSARTVARALYASMWRRIALDKRFGWSNEEDFL